MLTIEYELTIPELSAVVPPIVERWRWLIPGWLHSLTITTNTIETVNYQAKTAASYPYRWARITVDTNFLSEELDRERNKTIVHEIVHLVLWPINENDKLWCGDDKAISAIWCDGVEGAVQDLSEALISRYYEEGR